MQIREYKSSDKNTVITLLEELQDYLVSIDQKKRLIRAAEFGEVVWNDDLKDVKENDGIIYLAEEDKQSIGFIAGTIEEKTTETMSDVDRVQVKPIKAGKLLELYVQKQYRNQNVGSQLMEALENYFRKHKCTHFWTDVFAYNTAARRFYTYWGFEERDIFMTKEIL
jgi:ribosomal protein S18 acetylase RimI-like enzyme